MLTIYTLLYSPELSVLLLTINLLALTLVILTLLLGFMATAPHIDKRINRSHHTH